LGISVRLIRISTRSRNEYRSRCFLLRVIFRRIVNEQRFGIFTAIAKRNERNDRRYHDLTETQRRAGRADSSDERHVADIDFRIREHFRLDRSDRRL